MHLICLINKGMKPPILLKKKEEFTYFSKNENFSINEDWRDTVSLTYTEVGNNRTTWLCRKEYASHLLGVLCRSPYVLLALLMWEIKGQGLGRDILLGNKCSTEPLKLLEPKIHVFNETSKERWWHQECPADYLWN